jgi:hypothetical protein
MPSTPIVVLEIDDNTPRELPPFTMDVSAVACCRRIWNLIPDKPGHQAVEQAERYADVMASRQQLARARRACFPRSYINRQLFERDNAWCAMIAVPGWINTCD